MQVDHFRQCHDVENLEFYIHTNMKDRKIVNSGSAKHDEMQELL